MHVQYVFQSSLFLENLKKKNELVFEYFLINRLTRIDVFICVWKKNELHPRIYHSHETRKFVKVRRESNFA